MQQAFEHQVQENFPFLKGANLFLAISGGKDSMVLSHLLKCSGMDHTLLHCNFNLRGEESDIDEAFVKGYADANGLKIHSKHFDTETASEKMGLNIQETARKLRYDWFHTFLEDEHSYLLTAHHLDDSIETFFINLLRGTSIKGLRGIPKINDKIVRPLSYFTVDEIYNYIDEHGIRYRKDSSNDSQKYRRNKLRMALLPEFKELEPQFQLKMTNLLDDANAVVDYLKLEAEKVQNVHFSKDGDRISFPCTLLSETHEALLPYVFGDFGVQRKNLPELIKVGHAETGAKFRSSEFIFLKDREQVIISKEVVLDFFEVMVSNLPTQINSPLGALNLEQKEFDGKIKNGNIQQFELEQIVLPLLVRRWEAGDRMRPLGLGGSKLISDILIDKKIDSLSKDQQLVLQDGSGNILALVGLVVSEDYKVTDSTQEVVELTITTPA